jgi:CxxC motif-containing protein (DUF1111 family)
MREMKSGFLRKCAFLAVVCAAARSGSGADRTLHPVDPGVRPGAASVGAALAGVDAQYFANLRSTFNQVHSIAGDIESGVGLGPRFNGTSCGACHAYPTAGGSSPKQNPQPGMAAAHGARNRIPAFLKMDGPVLAVRLKRSAGSTGPGEVLPLFTVSGRSDAYRCALDQPDFTDEANLSFRIPTPVFGAGLIDNISDAAILANRAARPSAKIELGIRGEPNITSNGTVGKFGWKAQHHTLAQFAEDAYRTEMGVRNETSGYRHDALSRACYALYDAAYEDPNFSSSYGMGEEPSAFPFTEFMRFLAPPAVVSEFPGVTAESIRAGRLLFDRVGCALCHTPSLRTGDESTLPSLNGRDVPIFSDLLLHHMGPKLADGIVQGRAGSDEFRSAPLWGIGQRVFFLHDGRTADLLVAIREHAGEADRVTGRFNRLSPAEQQEIVDFLRSL